MFKLKYKSVYFVVTYVEKATDDLRTDKIKKFFDFNKELLLITHYNDIYTFKNIKVFKTEIDNEFWKGKLNEIKILNAYQEEDFFVTKILYDLSIDSIHMFLFERNIEIVRTTINSLIVETFPDLNRGEFSENEKYYNLLFKSGLDFSTKLDGKFFTHLILRPDEKINIYEDKQTTVKYLSELEKVKGTRFEKKETYYIPYQTKYFIETFTGNFFARSMDPWIRIFIGSQCSQKDLYIEKGIVDIIDTDIWLFFINQINEKLTNETIIKNSIEEITNSLINTRNPLQVINKYFKNYILKINSDLSKFESIYTTYQDRFNSTQYLFSEKMREFYEIRDFTKEDGFLISWSFLSRKNSKQVEELKKLEDYIKKINQRIKSLSDFLNTFYLMHSTKTNLNLQKQMKIIALIAFVLAIISIFCTLFSDEISKRIIEMVNCLN